MKNKSRLKLKKMLLLFAVTLMTTVQLSALQTVKVSVPFNVGYIGTEGNNPQDNLNVKSLTTLGIQRVSFGQTTSTGEFFLQGNDILGELEFLLLDGTVKTLNASLTWRVTTGNKIEAFGFIPVHGDSITYTYNSIPRKIFGSATSGSDVLLVALNSTFRWNDGDNVNGNAATSGLLDALNDYLDYINANKPAGPLTVTTDTICSENTAPKIKGSVTLAAGENFSVYFYNQKQTATLTGNEWTANVPGALTTGAIAVKAEITNALGAVLTKYDTVNVVNCFSNTSPFAVNDLASGPMNSNITGNVLTNDTDSDGGTLTVTKFTIGGTDYTAGNEATISGKGKLTINANGTYTFVPEPNYYGSVPVVTYTVTDGQGGTATATLTLSLTNNKPVVDNEIITTNENEPIDGDLTDVGDTDSECASLTASTVPDVAPKHGTIVITADGKYTYTPAANYSGKDTVVVSICDCGVPAQCVSDTIFITVSNVNGLPDAKDDNAFTQINTPVKGNVLANDTDPENNPLTVTTFNVGGTDYPAGSTVTIPGKGTLTLKADGTFNFVPATDFVGEVPAVTYTVSDGQGGTDTAKLTITVFDPSNVNAPVKDDMKETMPNTPVSGNLLNNDLIVNGKIDSIQINGQNYPIGQEITIPNVGKIIVNANGTFTFTPVNGFTGAVPAITYFASDDKGNFYSAELEIVVKNNKPIASDDSAIVNEDGVLNGSNLLSNDTDPDNGILTINTTPVANTTNGTLIINADGTYKYTPNPNFFGTDTFKYAVCDNGTPTQCDTATVTITVTDTFDNTAPSANDDRASASKNSTVIGNVLANDTDTDGGILTVTKFTMNGVDYAANTQAVIPGKGKLTILANGSFVFTPEKDYVGPVPTVTYQISDGQGGTASADLRINVYEDESPTAPVQDDVNEVQPGAAATGKVFENDQIPGAVVDSIQIEGKYYAVGTPVVIPEVGTIQVDANGNYTFNPLPQFFGSVPTVTYLATDNTGEFHSADLVIKVKNADPIAVNDEFTLNEGDVLNDNILNNDTDPNGSDLLVTGFTIAGQNYPVNTPVVIEGVGEITINADGTFAFVPVNLFGGNFPTITYAVSDGNGGVATAQINVTYVPAELFIPDGFSPNGDGINDKFVIRGLGAFPNNELRILNRWGNIVFEAKNYANDWDGTANTGVIAGGSELPVATYFYVLNLGNNNIKTGYIYLSR